MLISRPQEVCLAGMGMFWWSIPFSLRALDALNAFLADVRDGLGPYLAIYLSTRAWAPGTIGMAMSAMGLATVAAQTPAGALIDSTRHKRMAIVVAALAVALSAITMVLRPTLPVILSTQAVMGLAAAVFAPAVAAVTLGLVGRARFARRTGRNEAFNHAGNLVAAVLAGAIGTYIARLRWSPFNFSTASGRAFSA